MVAVEIGIISVVRVSVIGSGRCVIIRAGLSLGLFLFFRTCRADDAFRGVMSVVFADRLLTLDALLNRKTVAGMTEQEARCFMTHPVVGFSRCH